MFPEWKRTKLAKVSKHTGRRDAYVDNPRGCQTDVFGWNICSSKVFRRVEEVLNSLSQVMYEHLWHLMNRNWNYIHISTITLRYSANWYLWLNHFLDFMSPASVRKRVKRQELIYNRKHTQEKTCPMAKVKTSTTVLSNKPVIGLVNAAELVNYILISKWSNECIGTGYICYFIQTEQLSFTIIIRQQSAFVPRSCKFHWQG